MSIKVDDATQIAKKNNPEITEYETRSIVKSSSSLDLRNDDIKYLQVFGL
jgi:hypothetical protein